MITLISLALAADKPQKSFILIVVFWSTTMLGKGNFKR
jgi:hypothetical protein